MSHSFWQPYRGNFPVTNRLSAIFPVCWPEPGFSLMSNMNNLLLLLFSSCINKLLQAVERGACYSITVVTMSNKIACHVRCFPKGHLCPDKHPYRKCNEILLKYHPDAKEHCVNLLNDLLHQ